MEDETVVSLGLPDSSFAAGVDADFSVQTGTLQWDVNIANAVLVLLALGVGIFIRKGM
jgi:hypothetical protein